MSNKPAHCADRQAVVEVQCPACKAAKGADCQRRDGVRYPRTHATRILAYRDKIGSEEFTKRHSTHMIGVRKFNPRVNTP